MAPPQREPPDKLKLVLLGRADQAAVATIALLALASMAAWWLTHGGHRGGLIEIDRADPLEARFQIDINTAQWPEFAQLPGIGETLARRIVDSRTAQGPFPGRDELSRVRGIGPKTMERIRPYLLPIPSAVDVAGP